MPDQDKAKNTRPGAGFPARGNARLLAVLFALTAAAILAADLLIHAMPAGPGWNAPEVHALIEVLEAGVALGAVFLTLQVCAWQPGLEYLIWPAAGLTAMAILSLFHVVTRPGGGFVWLSAVSTLAGGALFALGFLPDRFARTRLAARLPRLAGGAALILSILTLWRHDLFPVMLEGEAFTPLTKAMGLGGGLLFAADGARHFRRYRASGLMLDAMLAWICLLSAAAGVLLFRAALWQWDWWFVHFIRLAAYGSIFGFMLAWFRYRQEERRRDAISVRETRDYLDNLITHANAPIIIWDPRFKITRLNPAFAELLGRKPEEMAGEPMETLFPPEQVAASMEHIRRALSGERWEAIEIEILHRDGSVRTLLWNSATIFEEDGKTPKATIAQGQDITERKRKEKELRETRDYLDNLITHANAPIIIWDPRFKITRLNRAFAALLGRRPEEMAGEPMETLFPPEQVAASMEHIRRALSGERWEAIEIEILHRDGSVRTLLWNSATIFREDGKTPEATIAQGQDITERKQKEKELLEKNDELTRFVYTVSHDLKSPLVTIGTFAGYLAKDIKNSDLAAQEKDFFFIRGATDRMSRLLDELLELSSVGRKVNPSTEMPLQDVVREALTLVGGRVAECGAALKITDREVTLYGDRVRLVEVFQNLLDNAMKFTVERRPPVVEVGVEQQGAETVLFVRDNGAGIDQRHQTKLFGLFEKLDPGTHGTGVGLALVRRIIELHGGRIWAESAGAGTGTIFRFTLAKTKMAKAAKEKRT